MRVGDYHVIHEIDNLEYIVVISAIRHRKDSY
ncbi:type II toxin-antitoxin system RelE family toxin [Wolbachia endosymbiont of Atemnus politus]|nr:hypothetical protein [Wolbachia endosymbiont of Atemnus politus]